jgi:DNA primase
MRYENIEFPEAVETLAKKAGVALPRNAAREDSQLVSLAGALYNINDLACQFFQASLSNNNTAKEYLRSRGIADQTAKLFRLGYAPDAWEGLLNALKKRGCAEPMLEKAGLIISNERGGYYDRFRNRIIFPIIDTKDRVVGFGGRVLDSSLPKYINSPETYIYSKGRNLYGLNLSRDAVKKEGYALIVEGYLDLIIPYQAGVTNLIATLGTALTTDQVKVLKRFANTVIMVYDPDEAGEAASLRNLDTFISEDVNVYIAELQAGLDPDSYIRKFGTDEFLKTIKSSKNIFDYKLEKVSAKFDIKSAHGKARIAAEMLPTIARINNAVMKSTLIKKLAEKLVVDEDALKAEFKKIKPDYSVRRPLEEHTPPKADTPSAEKLVIALLLEGGDILDRVEKELSLDDFADATAKDLAAVIFDIHKENKTINPARLINRLGTNSAYAALVSEAVNLSEMVVDKEKVLSDCIARIKRDRVKGALKRLQAEIKIAHDSRDDAKLKELLAEYDNLVKADRV